MPTSQGQSLRRATAGRDYDVVSPTSLVEQGREAYAGRSWATAYEHLAAADAECALGPSDRERLGLAAFLTGRDGESDAARERAHHDFLVAGDAEGAARVGFWLALALTTRGESSRGGGWFARVQRVLDEAGLDGSVWHGYLLVAQGMGRLFAGDRGAALDVLEQATAVAEQHADADLAALARHGHGQGLVMDGAVGAGLAELDEVMVLVTTGDVSPQVVGLVYCAVIETCRECFDLRRGREWTDALTRWCESQPDLVPYRGQCLVHRAEILQVQGAWPEAMAEAQAAYEVLREPPGRVAVGMALYQRGELLRLQGRNADAEAEYRAASQHGHDPQPGLAVLRLAQGRVDVALTSVSRALDEAGSSPRPPRLLVAYVEIALAAGEVGRARAAAEELVETASTLEGSLLTAAGLHASGAVLLAEGRHREGLGVLRRAWSAWQDLQAPYDAAGARVLIAQACRSLGDEDTAEMELDAARWVFEQLGAVPDVERVAEMSRRPSRTATPGGLTLREVQVLRLVATGATNRAIAGELFLSEKTVARHVANIFTKLDLSSRAAATAYAYEHDLV